MNKPRYLLFLRHIKSGLYGQIGQNSPNVAQNSRYGLPELGHEYGPYWFQWEHQNEGRSAE